MRWRKIGKEAKHPDQQRDVPGEEFPALFENGIEIFKTVANRAVLYLFAAGRGDDVKINIGKGLKRRQTALVTVEIVEISGGKTPQLFKQIPLVCKRMMKLLEHLLGALYE